MSALMPIFIPKRSFVNLKYTNTKEGNKNTKGFIDYIIDLSL